MRLERLNISCSFFARMGCFILPEGACGEGIFKGNFVPLKPKGGLEPFGRGSKFFATFFQKKLGSVCDFADAVPNGRILSLSKKNFARLG